MFRPSLTIYKKGRFSKDVFYSAQKTQSAYLNNELIDEYVASNKTIAECMMRKKKKLNSSGVKPTVVKQFFFFFHTFVCICAYVHSVN